MLAGLHSHWAAVNPAPARDSSGTRRTSLTALCACCAPPVILSDHC